ncbi:DUF3618 domain-containing protein [Roseococcus sp. YIM B11640]|uniref:DUF3618 domain-containing protein n=1 Tax=Roseococcus sp. YIM B11640 TaxID=3133973 RepID=UPI003C7E56C5
MSNTSTDPGNRSPADIEDDVERSRAEVSGTLGALREKLAPGQIMDEVIDRVAEYARGTGGMTFARNLGGAVRDNPLPVLLIGAGIGWLMLSQASPGPAQQERDPLRLPPPRRPYPDEGEGFVAEAASSLASSAVAGAAGAAWAVKSVGENVGSATARVGSAVKGGWSSASGALGTQPLLLGLLGVAAGAALGAALPRTEVEDDLLGDAADAAMERVSETAEQVRAAAGEHLRGAADAVAEGYEKVKDRLEEGSLSGATEALGDALSATAKATQDAATGLAGEVRDQLEPQREERRDAPRDRPSG